MRRVKTEIAIRRKQVLEGIQQNKKLKEIAKALGAPYEVIRHDKVILLEKMQSKKAAKLRTLVASTVPYKFTVAKATGLISLAQKIIKGEAELLKPKNPMQRDVKTRPVEAGQIMQELRSTNKNLVQISKEKNTDYNVVVRIYHALIANGEKIPVRMSAVNRAQKDKARITGILKQEQVAEIMGAQEAHIVNASKRMYNFYKPVFNAAAMGWEDIAQYVRKELPWKLLTFNPANWGGKSLEGKIQACCRRQINFLALDMKKRAEKSPELQSLDKIILGDEAAVERVIKLKDAIAKKEPMPLLGTKKIIKIIETIARKAFLTEQEKALIYGKVAGITERQIAKIVGLSEMGIWYCWRSIKTKLSAAGIKPNSIALVSMVKT